VAPGWRRKPIDPVAELATWCRERAFWIGPGDEIRTDAAAAVLGVSAQWLRQLRCYFPEQSPPWRRAGRHCVYRLGELLEWREAYRGIAEPLA
jgi:hypothetical protein